MNIVYFITNKTKQSGKRFYIGSKTECKLVNIDGVDKIVNLKDGKVYNTSSTCNEFAEDLVRGHTFEAKILEVVDDRSELLSAENSFIVKYDAVNSDDFYNKSYAKLNGVIDKNKVLNVFGETVDQCSTNNRAISKRDNTAIKLGFKNMFELSIFIHSSFESGIGYSEISANLNKERHFAQKYIQSYDMNKCASEVKCDTHKDEVIRMYFNKATMQKISEITGLELPTVRFLIGDLTKPENKSFLVAKSKGFTRNEMEDEITNLVISGLNTKEVSNILGINETSVMRYFINCVRRRLGSSVSE